VPHPNTKLILEQNKTCEIK